MNSIITTEVRNCTNARVDILLGGGARLYLQAAGKPGDTVTLNGDLFTKITYDATATMLKKRVNDSRLRLIYWIEGKQVYDSAKFLEPDVFGSTVDASVCTVGDVEIKVTEPSAVTVENAEETYKAHVVVEDDSAKEAPEAPVVDELKQEETATVPETTETEKPMEVSEQTIEEVSATEEKTVEEPEIVEDTIDTKPVRKTRSKKIKVD